VRRAAPAVLIFGLLAVASRLAAANGAFPDSQTVLTPADRPLELILVTNFGLVISEDGGQSWQWSCERDTNAYGILYQQGPAPRHRLFTVAGNKLAFSDDGSCGWQLAGGALAGELVTDAFPDAGDADRVLAIGYTGGRYGVFASRDGGATFDGPLYQAPSGTGIGGAESALGDARIIYVAMTDGATSTPYLARSGDGGATWTKTDLSPMVGLGVVRIIAVEPDDPNVVLLRVLGADGQSFAIARDGGTTVTTTLSIGGTFTSYVRLPDGTRLLGALVDSSTTPALYRSRDGGASFAAVDHPPAVRALSQRGGLVYAATDNFGDGYALGVSSDQGTTWQAVMSYGQVQAILGCVRDDAQCRATCDALAGQGTSASAIWDPGVCTANPAAEPVEPLPEPSTAPTMKIGGGCGCMLGASTSGPGVGGFVAVALLVGRRRRRPTAM
jgi:hypothetical protein